MKLAQMIRNLWIYRKVILLAIILGVVLSFLWTNDERVRVRFPFVERLDSSLGIVMLVSALLGAGATWLYMTFRRTIVQAREMQGLKADSRAEQGRKQPQPDAPIEPSESRSGGTEQHGSEKEAQG